jgi:hypothetical protein
MVNNATRFLGFLSLYLKAFRTFKAISLLKAQYNWMASAKGCENVK